MDTPMDVEKARAIRTVIEDNLPAGYEYLLLVTPDRNRNKLETWGNMPKEHRQSFLLRMAGLWNTMKVHVQHMGPK